MDPEECLLLLKLESSVRPDCQLMSSALNQQQQQQQQKDQVCQTTRGWYRPLNAVNSTGFKDGDDLL